MYKYIGKRILYGFITCFLVLIIVFLMARLSGDPLKWLLPPRAGATVRAQIMAKYGLDKSIFQQFISYVGNVLRFDFGESFYFKRPAIDVILEHTPATLQIAGLGLLLGLCIALPIGIYSAKNKDSAFDYIARGFSFFAVSAPGFWIGIVLVWFFAIRLKVLPAGGNTEPYTALLPIITIAIGQLGSVVRLTRSSMNEVLETDYVKLARAKGAPESRVLWIHSFKNASTSVITMIMMTLTGLLSGDVVIEQVFSWPGVGRLIMQAVATRDYPLIQTFTLVIGVLFVLFSIAADILYAVVNPKVRNFSQ